MVRKLYKFSSMTSGTENLDRLIKEYLVFRGFIQTAKSFDAELRADKDKGLRADLIVEAILSYILSYNLPDLIEYWKGLDERIFSRLELFYHSCTKKLYFSLLKYYVVYASTNNKQDKVMEFFNLMGSQLQSHAEWKDWFAFPFTKSPETVDVFSVYFGRHWQDRLQLSLFNYLSIVFQSMPTPALMELLKMPPTSSLQRDTAVPRVKTSLAWLKTSIDITDDFYNITQSQPLENQSTSKGNVKSLVAKGIAKVKGQQTTARKSKAVAIPTSNKSSPTGQLTTQVSVDSIKPSASLTQPTGRSRRPISAGADYNEMRQELLSTNASTSGKPSLSGVSSDTAVLTRNKEIVRDSSRHGLSRISSDVSLELEADLFQVNSAIYNKHKSSITHARFSKTGRSSVSTDIDGAIKVWTNESFPITTCSTLSDHLVTCVDWLDPRDQYIVFGGKSGLVRVYDVNSSAVRYEKNISDERSNARLSDLSTQAAGAEFACAANTVSIGDAELGVISTWDANLGTKTFSTTTDVMVRSLECCLSDSALLAGCENGTLKLIDTRMSGSSTLFQAFSAAIVNISTCQDDKTCFMIDSNNNVSKFDLRTRSFLVSYSVHANATGPFSFSGKTNHNQKQTAKGRVFASSPDGSYLITCHSNSALIYKVLDKELRTELMIEGQQAPVVAVDWSVSEPHSCLLGDMFGQVKLVTLQHNL